MFSYSQVDTFFSIITSNYFYKVYQKRDKVLDVLRVPSLHKERYTVHAFSILNKVWFIV